MADVTMPQLGETVTEGTITRWFKQVGDSVAEDEVLFEVSTDKVDSEVPSPVAGTIQEILVPEGETVDVGAMLARIGDGAGGGGGGEAAPAEDAPIEQAQGGEETRPESTEAPAAEPAFAVGQAVRTRRRVASDHTRLPRYALDVRGRVIEHHGAHLLPDEGAKGNHVGDHLYTVAFAATELWGPDADPRDSVTLDLWERYLVPA